jgi:hypothetical protein
MPATQLCLTRDVNGYVSYGLQFSVKGAGVLLAQNTAQFIVIPGEPTYSVNKWSLVFSFDPGLRIFVAYTPAAIYAGNMGNIITAAVPSGTLNADFDTYHSELNPVSREVFGGDVVSLITPDTSAYVTIKAYALQQ